MISKPRDGVKILGVGEISAKLAFEVAARLEIGHRRHRKGGRVGQASQCRGGGRGGRLSLVAGEPMAPHISGFKVILGIDPLAAETIAI